MLQKLDSLDLEKNYHIYLKTAIITMPTNPAQNLEINVDAAIPEMPRSKNWTVMKFPTMFNMFINRLIHIEVLVFPSPRKIAHEQLKSATHGIEKTRV